MNKDIKRFKELINYPLDEEMEVTKDFDTNDFIINKDSNVIGLNVSVDVENPKEYLLQLIMRYLKRGNSFEMVFYWYLTDDKGNKVFETYEYGKADKYIPKTILHQNKILPKVDLMTKELLKIHKPNEFFMRTHSNTITQSQVDKMYANRKKIILDSGYEIIFDGFEPGGKYAMQFRLKGSGTQPSKLPNALTEEELYEILTKLHE